MVEKCETAGVQLAQAITKAKKAQAKAILDAEKASGESKFKIKNEAEMASEARLLQAFGQIINSSCVITFPPAQEGEEGIRVPVSWISQASFTPPGLMLAIEKKGLDSFLDTTPEEQLEALFLKYDKDGSGELDREEIDPMLTELLGAEVGSASEEMLKAKKEEAMAILDADGGGLVDREELQAAAKEGPFADMLAQQRRMAGLEDLLDSDSAVLFTINMLPEGMSEEDALKAPAHKKKKAKNGATVIDGVTSFVECQLDSLASAGSSTIMYALVKEGDLVEEAKRTELLRADHVVIDHAAQDSASEKQEEVELTPA
jgi:flavin reductase (DIM6/NTAB) family NADH-FMN oxidoreductase RutF